MTEAKRFQGIELSLIRRIMANAAPGAVNMALGELGYPMPPFIRDEAHILLDRGNAVYTPNAGLGIAREAVANYIDTGYSADNVCITNGAEEAIYLSLLALSDPGARIAIPDPDYTAYPAIAKLMGLDIVRLQYGEGFISVNWKEWENILSDKVRFLLLSSPQNPSGKYFNNDELINLATICNRHRITVIIDEIYRELWFDKRPPETLGIFDQAVYIGGLSKSHCMSGWRIGWAISTIETISVITKAKQYVSTCSPWLSQMLIPIALSEEGLLSMEAIRQNLMESRAIFARAVGELVRPSALHLPNAGPYAMIKAGDDLKVANHLAERGLIAVPGRAFGDVSTGWLRLNYALPDEQLAEGIAILQEYLREIDL